MELIKKFFKEEDGATVVEYALIVALISIAVAATVVLVGSAVNDKFDQVQNCIKTNGANCGTTPPAGG